MKLQYFTVLVVLFVSLLVGGCSTSTKHYKIDLPHNLEIISNTESVEVTLDIYNLGKQCEATYMGTIAVDENSPGLGIATGRLSYLVVGFANSSFWGSSSGYIDYDITLLPRQAYRYQMSISYIDDIYRVMVYEIDRATEKKREMEDRELRSCPQ
jgi:hypothetical protein